MKKLLLKSLFFIIIWFFILECFFDPRFKRITNFHHTNVEFKDSKKAALDLIFLGSSHAEQSYIPYIFDNALNINSHNFGCSGQRLVVTNVVLKEFLKTTKVKAVVLDLFWGSFDYPDSDEEKGLQLIGLDELNFSLEKFRVSNEIYDFKELPSVFSPTIRNHNQWTDKLFGAKSKTTRPKLLWSKGYAGSNKVLTQEQLKKIKLNNGIFNNFINKPSQLTKGQRTNFDFSALKKTIEICKKNNVQLIAVTAPAYSVFNYPGSKNFYIQLDKFCQKSGIDYINFNKSFNESGFNESHFRDMGHLNTNGAVMATTKLVNFLIKKGYFFFEDDILLNDKIKSASNSFINVKNIEPYKNISTWTKINNEIKILEKSKHGRVMRLERINDTSSSYVASKNFNVVNGQEYSMSILAKPLKNEGFLGLRLSGVYPDRLDAVFDLSSSEVQNTFSGGDFHLTDASAVELDDGWVKCEIRGRVSSELVRIIFGPTNSRIRPGIWESKAVRIKKIKIIPESIKVQQAIEKK